MWCTLVQGARCLCGAYFIADYDGTAAFMSVLLIFTVLYIVCHDGGNPWWILLIYYKFECDSTFCCDSMIYYKLLLIKHCVAACCNDSCIILLLYVCVVCCHVYDHITNVLANHLTVYGCSLVDKCCSGHGICGSTVAVVLCIYLYWTFHCLIVVMH